MRRSGLQTAGLDAGVELLQMLRFQPIQPVRPDPRYQMPLHSGAVADVGLVPNRWPSDVLQPVREPLLNRPGAAGLSDDSLITLAFQLLDLGGYRRLVFAAHVPPIRSSVVTHAHRDAAVPGAIFAEVDAGPAVRRSRLALGHQATWPCLALRRLT